MYNEKLFYLATIIVGLLLVVVIYAPYGSPPKRPAEADDAPSLSAIPFHQSFVDEETCLRCHTEARQINLQGEIMESMAVSHEPRENCIVCHSLPNML